MTDDEFQKYQKDYYIMKKESKINLLDSSKVKYKHAISDAVKLQMVLMSEVMGLRQPLGEAEVEQLKK